MNIGWIALPLLLYLFPAARRLAFWLLVALALWLFWRESPALAITLVLCGGAGGLLLAACTIHAQRSGQPPPPSPTSSRAVRHTRHG